MPFDGQKLKTLRQAKGLGRGDFQPIAETTIKSLEVGARPNPGVNSVEIISRKLGVEMRELMSPAKKGEK